MMIHMINIMINLILITYDILIYLRSLHNLLGLDNQRFTQLYGSGTQTLPGGQKECLTKGKLGIGKGGHWERWMDGWMRNRKGKCGQWESLNVHLHVSSLQPCGKKLNTSMLNVFLCHLL